MLRPVKIRQYLVFMKAKGYAAVDVLAGSRIKEADLSDPGLLIGLDQAKQVVTNMISLTRDPSIGYQIGERTEMVDVGVVSFAMMSARSAREATQYWINYCNALIGMLVSVKLEERAVDDWSLVLSPAIPLKAADNLCNFCIEEQLLMIHKLGGQLYSEAPRYELIELSYQKPPHHALYEKHFTCPIRFDAPVTRLTFAFPRLDQTINGTDKEFNETCARQCELLLKQIDRQSPILAKIKELLLRSGGRNPGISALARDMKVSVRTLSRHLNDQGLTFHHLVTEFRKDMAKEYLRSVSVSTKEISHFLGFQDTNSFRRAFKSWTGQTIQEYRDQHRIHKSGSRG